MKGLKKGRNACMNLLMHEWMMELNVRTWTKIATFKLALSVLLALSGSGPSVFHLFYNAFGLPGGPGEGLGGGPREVPEGVQLGVHFGVVFGTILGVISVSFGASFRRSFDM